MVDVGVIDTGVLIGFTIKNDQHHETTKDYIVNGNFDNIYFPPTANQEYKQVEPKIRKKLHQEISSHRQAVMREVNDHILGPKAIQFIRDGVLDDDKQERAYAFLYRYYTDLHKTGNSILKSDIVKDLSNMETEVYVDQSQQFGGWKKFVKVWTRGMSSYSGLKSSLLLPAGNDLEILIEAHHVPKSVNPKSTEFATANPSDFTRKHDSEPRSREDDILNNTKIHSIEDLSNPLTRHFP